MSTREEILIEKKQAMALTPFTITEEEEEDFKTLCETHYGRASATPFQPPPTPPPWERGKPAPRPAKDIIARHVGLKQKPTRTVRGVKVEITSYQEFLAQTESAKIEICTDSMYPLEEAEKRMLTDKLLSSFYQEITRRLKEQTEKLTREQIDLAITLAYRRTCEERIRRYFNILSTPELINYYKPEMERASTISLIACRTPDDPRATVDRDTTIRLINNMCTRNYKFPYNIESVELQTLDSEIRVESTRYITTIAGVRRHMDETTITITRPVEPKVPEGGRELLIEYLKRYKRDILRQTRTAEQLEYIALDIFTEQLKRTITSHIQAFCKPLPMPVVTKEVTFKNIRQLLQEENVIARSELHQILISAMEQMKIEIPLPAPLIPQPLCPLNVEVLYTDEFTNPQLITKLGAEGEHEIVEELLSQRIKKMTIKITACTDTCPALQCLLTATAPQIVDMLIETTVKRLRFIQI